MQHIINSIYIIFIGLSAIACSLVSNPGPVHLNEESPLSEQKSVSLASSSALGKELKVEAVIKNIEKLSQKELKPAIEKNFWKPDNILSIPYFYLTPGDYEIKLHGSWDKYWVNSGLGYTYVENIVRINLKAGHKYMPIVQANNTEINFSIVDLGTNFNPKCFPYYQKMFLAKMDIGRSKANEMTNYAKNNGCDWK